MEIIFIIFVNDNETVGRKAKIFFCVNHVNGSDNQKKII